MPWDPLNFFSGPAELDKVGDPSPGGARNPETIARDDLLRETFDEMAEIERNCVFLEDDAEMVDIVSGFRQDMRRLLGRCFAFPDEASDDACAWFMAACRFSTFRWSLVRLLALRHGLPCFPGEASVVKPDTSEEGHLARRNSQQLKRMGDQIKALRYAAKKARAAPDEVGALQKLVKQLKAESAGLAGRLEVAETSLKKAVDLNARVKAGAKRDVKRELRSQGQRVVEEVYTELMSFVRQRHTEHTTRCYMEYRVSAKRIAEAVEGANRYHATTEPGAQFCVEYDAHNNGEWVKMTRAQHPAVTLMHKVAQEMERELTSSAMVAVERVFEYTLGFAKYATMTSGARNPDVLPGAYVAYKCKLLLTVDSLTGTQTNTATGYQRPLRFRVDDATQQRVPDLLSDLSTSTVARDGCEDLCPYKTVHGILLSPEDAAATSYYDALTTSNVQLYDAISKWLARLQAVNWLPPAGVVETQVGTKSSKMVAELATTVASGTCAPVVYSKSKTSSWLNPGALCRFLIMAKNGPTSFVQVAYHAASDYKAMEQNGGAPSYVYSEAGYKGRGVYYGTSPAVPGHWQCVVIPETKGAAAADQSPFGSSLLMLVLRPTTVMDPTETYSIVSDIPMHGRDTGVGDPAKPSCELRVVTAVTPSFVLAKPDDCNCCRDTNMLLVLGKATATKTIRKTAAVCTPFGVA